MKKISEQFNAIIAGVFNGQIKSLNDVCTLHCLTMPVAKERLRRILRALLPATLVMGENGLVEKQLDEPYFTLNKLFDDKNYDGFITWCYQNNGMNIEREIRLKARKENEDFKLKIWGKFYEPLSINEALAIVEDINIQNVFAGNTNPFSAFSEAQLYLAPEIITEHFFKYLTSVSKTHFLLYRGEFQTAYIKNVEKWLNLKGGVFLGDISLTAQKQQRLDKAIKYLTNNGYSVIKNA